MVAVTQSTASSLLATLNSSNSQSASSATQGVLGTASPSDLQNQFMTLFVTQLQNQDPMNPMDTSQMTAQLAQISTVSGISQLNATMQALSSSMMSSSAASLIGHGVLVPGSSLVLSNGQGVAGLQLSQAADSVVVKIADGSGNTVRTLQLGAQPAGVVPVVWNGQTDAGTAAANGTYTITAQAVQGGNASAATTLSYGTVSAITPNASGMSLDVGQLGSFALSAVQKIY
jgi:flagellar basal-body rod modification protein FlgD